MKKNYDIAVVEKTPMIKKVARQRGPPFYSHINNRRARKVQTAQGYFKC